MAGVEEFLGSWREEEKTGYEEMANALGLPPDKREFYKNAKTEITYNKDGDQWTIDVGMQGVPQSKTFRFKLGEHYESQSLDGSPLKSLIVAEDGRFIETHIDSGMDNMEMKITRYMDNSKMIVITKIGALAMQSVYGRI